MSTRDERFRMIDGAVRCVVSSKEWARDVERARRAKRVGKSQNRREEFRVRDMTYARRVSAILEVLKRHVPWALHSLSIAAISRFARVKDFDDAQMVKKIETHPHLLKRCATLEMFSDMFDEVYNHMSRSRIPLAFLAREEMAKRAALGERRKEKCANARAA